MGFWQQQLYAPDCFKGNQTKEAKALMDALKKEIEGQLKVEKEQALEKVTYLQKRIRSMQEYSELATDHTRLLNKLDDAVSRSKKEFIGRFRGKYTNEPRLPLWMAVEVMTFGQLFTLFRNLNRGE